MWFFSVLIETERSEAISSIDRNEGSSARTASSRQLRTASSPRPSHGAGLQLMICALKGALAQYSGLAMDVAFDRLRYYARSLNLRLSELARRIVAKQADLAEVLAPTPTDRRQ